MQTKTIVILAVPGVQLLDVSGPLDVFAEANTQLGQQMYRLAVATEDSGPLRSSSGIRILPDIVITQKNKDILIDTLLVAGSPNATNRTVSRVTLKWLRENMRKSRRYGSVCSGAFYLAATGLLNDRHVTTHWAVADTLAEQYPDIIVEKDAIHISDGPLRTAAGVTSGLDLALSLVEEDLGTSIAKQVASQLVMFFKRPGGQMQFTRKGETEPIGHTALQELQRWVAANPGLDHSIANLAQRLNLSPRHFSRIFRNEIGVSPASWIKEIRVSTARKMLEQGDLAPKQVAACCGFGDIDTFRRVFIRFVGVTPADYRKHFAADKVVRL